MFGIPFFRYRCGISFILLLTCSGQVAADEQQKIAREMIQVLEAYAVYKMGQYDDAYARYLELAEAGNKQGMLNVAGMYAAGKGTEQDYKQALDWYRRAAEAGDTTAMFEVARAYDKGLGVQAAPMTAETWYRRSAEQDNGLAQWVLGSRLYERGAELEGLNWIRTAAKRFDNTSAQQFMDQLEGKDRSRIAPDETEKKAVMATLAAVDAAARTQDAQGMVAFLSPDADVRMRLPGNPSWNTLNRAELRALWQATFDQDEHYHYERSEPELLAVEGSVLAFSTIRERLGDPENTQDLEILENALLRVTSGRATIYSLRLDIRRLER